MSFGLFTWKSTLFLRAKYLRKKGNLISDCDNSGRVHLKETFGENGVPIRESSLSTEIPTNLQRLGQAVASAHAG